MRQRTVRTSALCIVLVATGALSGCGADATPGGSAVGTGPGTGLTVDTFAAAVVKPTFRAGTVHVRMTMEWDDFTVVARGDDVLSSTVAGQAMDRHISISNGSNNAKIHTILVDGVAYENRGAESHDKFARIDLSDKSDPAAREFNKTHDDGDEATILAEIGGALRSVQTVGTGEMDGVDVTHYRTVVAARASLEAEGALSLLSPKELRRLPRTFDYHYWVGNDDSLIRQTSYTVSGLAVETTLTRWGEPIDFRRPPASQILGGDPSGPQGSP
jgi:hypothetical protein